MKKIFNLLLCLFLIVVSVGCENNAESYLSYDCKINNKKVPYYYFEMYGEEDDLQNNEYISKVKTSYKVDEKSDFIYREYLGEVEIVKCNVMNSIIKIPEKIKGKKIIKIGGYIDVEYMESDPIDYSLRSCFESYSYNIIEEIELSSSVKEIIYNTFDIDTLERIEVDKNNPYYSSKDGVLYDKSGKIKLCVPPNHHSRNKD